jgi:SAM-dependent methyltransferase
MAALDLGCGPSVHTLELAEDTPSGHVTGIDVSECMLTEARQRAAMTRSNNIEFVQGDAQQLPLNDASVDFIWARLLFQHLRAPQRAIEEAWRVLKPGGRICLVDTDRETFFIHPEPSGWSNMVQFLIKRQAGNGGDGIAGRKLGTRLYAAGFTDVQVEFTGTSWTGSELVSVMNDLWLPAMRHSPFPPEMQEQVDKLFSEMSSVAAKPGTYMHWGWFVATASRPISG